VRRFWGVVMVMMVLACQCRSFDCGDSLLCLIRIWGLLRSSLGECIWANWVFGWSLFQ
jgi:hypothetical protein